MAHRAALPWMQCSPRDAFAAVCAEKAIER
jgi:hypothetical protein